MDRHFIVCKGEYKPITLSNGLRVLICSDRAADRAAAALDVHVGPALSKIPVLPVYTISWTVASL